MDSPTTLDSHLARNGGSITIGSSDANSDTLTFRSTEELIEQFDDIYRDARGDTTRIPWASAKPNPCMVAWLNAEGPSVLRPGARIVVVGCGLGYDACELADRGYDVTAFDICPHAVESARVLHPQYADCFMQADLLHLPTRMHSRFDLVVDIHTIQSLPPEHRQDIADAMATLVSHRGVLLSIARGRDAAVPLSSVEGPPFELTVDEMQDLMAAGGLRPCREIDDFLDDQSPPVRRLRGAFCRP